MYCPSVLVVADEDRPVRDVDAAVARQVRREERKVDHRQVGQDPPLHGIHETQPRQERAEAAVTELRTQGRDDPRLADGAREVG